MVEYAPSGQGEHVCEPSEEENVPGTHATHASEDVAPRAKLAEPGGHGTQLEPAYGPYEPAAQPVHCEGDVAPPGTCDVEPAGQGMHAASVCAPADGLYELFAHGTQAARRVAAPKLPGGQGKHALNEDAPASGWYVPAPHAEHTAALALPLLEPQVPIAHGMQADALLAPTTELHVPCGHGEHSEEKAIPAVAENFPAGQPTHAAAERAPVDG